MCHNYQLQEVVYCFQFRDISAANSYQSEIHSFQIIQMTIICCSVTHSRLTLCDPQTAALQAFLSFAISWSLLKLMFIELVIPSNYLMLYRSLLLLPQSLPGSRSFPTSHCIRWPKYWNFSSSISPSNEYLGLISFKID